MRWLCAIVIATAACKGSSSTKAAKQAEGSASHAAPATAVADERTWAIPYKNKGNEPIEQLSTSDGDGAKASTVVEKYLHGIAAKDWTTVCDQRLPAERADLARMGGTCENAYAAMMEDKAIALNATLYAYAVRRRGKLIAVDVVQPGQGGKKPFGTLLLGDEGERWYLIDLDDDQQF